MHIRRSKLTCTSNVTGETRVFFPVSFAIAEDDIVPHLPPKSRAFPVCFIVLLREHFKARACEFMK